MKETGLFDLLSNHLINNLVDYVCGVETGLDSNGRKNRGGHLMENLVEKYLKQANLTYYKEMYLNEIETKWNINLSSLSNNGKADKRFDFVVKTDSCIYGIETNFYSSSGSKLNETARSYKMLATEAKNIKGFRFVWFTDGLGWKSAKNNLEETFDVMEHIYNIDDIKNGIMSKIFK
jgi:type II restriction enzyme